MIQLLISVKDTAARTFMQPAFVPTTAVGQRSFSEAINDSKHDFHKYPTDFELYEIGAFDTETGELTSLDEPRLIVRGKDVLLPVFDGGGLHTS